ncbi:MAG: nuclear pore complex subunit [Bacteroidetes bacterium CG02_land_8_20_14_3_00_31_25]|nr:DUF1987 domain-containing protein [Bacteroidota bacterium]PIV58409.1 MAG: nuclear pore complex subunit [Bacteroidetes bacterium CG02_land_8_20_14_3_00_31_25]PIX32775.1 MAG: nuclear pore complex subunit [Bacteroidetes bacterium CG_4_8_14_3_um_filter_31_14]
MEKIIIDNQSGDTPKITLDKEANVFEICGKSFPENAVEFYSPVIKWINEYAQSPNPETIFTINLDYFNSSSSKKIFEILMKLEQITTTGGNILVKWYYDENDDVMFTRSKDIQDVLEIPIEFIKKTKKT